MAGSNAWKLSKDAAPESVAGFVRFKCRSGIVNGSGIILGGEEFTIQITRDYPEEAGVHANRYSTQAVATSSATLGGNSAPLARSFVELSPL
jgi:hypothetical protein